MRPKSPRSEASGATAAGADEHVADQHGVGMHVGGGMDDRRTPSIS